MGNTLNNKKDKYKEPQPEEEEPGEPLSPGQIFRGKEGLFSIKTGTLDKDLLAFLANDDWLQKSDEELMEQGFRKTVDHPYLDNHHQTDGYFHARKESHSMPSLNPRDGQYMDKPASPDRIRAFIQATKEKNKSLFGKLASCFAENSTMWQLFVSGNALCDLEIQSRYGTGITGDHLSWHLDNYNSMVHLAMGLTGGRTLHTRTVGEDNKVTKHANILQPGDVYLSSPAAFQHAVSRENLDREDRVVALQCRLLMTLQEFADIHREFTEDVQKKREALDKIAHIMEVGEFCLPSLEEVKKTLVTFDLNKDKW